MKRNKRSCLRCWKKSHRKLQANADVRNLKQPRQLRGITLKNRVISAPTSMGLGAEAWREALRRIAAGGCAMIIVGDVPVTRHGFGPLAVHGQGACLLPQRG